MNCKEVRKAVEDLRDAPAGGGRDAARPLDGLAAARPLDGLAAEVRVHVRGCPRCRALVEDEARLGSALALLRRRRVEVPPGFASGVRRRLAASKPEPREIVGWPFVLSAALSSAALAVIIGVAMRDTPRGEIATATPDPAAARAPVLWSDGRVEVVAGPLPDAPPAEPRQLAVLVEYDL